ncbi:MAG: hypothetical protein Q7K03_02555 [Dehalococcoidia bacterium]|nr:hypothetical protein [Dehalococcoidia bacterium]
MAIEDVLMEKMERLRKTRLAVECAKLDPVLEKALAEEGFAEDAEDIVACEERAHEPDMAFEDVLKDLKKRGRI